MNDNHGWIELIFIAVVALGLAFWQLWSVTREIKRDREQKGKE